MSNDYGQMFKKGPVSPLGCFCLILLIVLGVGVAIGFLVGCARSDVYAPPPPPVPVVDPPQPPGPTPWRVVTPEEFEAVVVGAATQADLYARFGTPSNVVPNEQENVVVLVYHSRTIDDPTRYAEFWIRGGRVVNKVVY